MTPATGQTKSGFFKLPGELRNRIYRLVLVEGVHKVDGYIEYTNTGYARPALLNTCKAIRLEARTIFYYENAFVTEHHKYDSSTMLKFWRQYLPRGLNKRNIETATKVRLDSEPNWANLLEWLKRYHARILCLPLFGLRALQQNSQATTEHLILAALFETAKSLKSQPWSVAEAVLCHQRPALESLDARWNKD